MKVQLSSDQDALDVGRAPVKEGIREMADAAHRSCPEAVASWTQRLEGEKVGLLQGWLLPKQTCDAGEEKENAPTGIGIPAGIVAVGSSDSMRDGMSDVIKDTQKRRVTLPARIGSPCKIQNALV